MMYGLGEEFAYFECSECGCLQIAEIPDNIERFYPYGYLSSFTPKLAEEPGWLYKSTRPDRYAMFHSNFIAQVLRKRYLYGMLERIAEIGVSPGSKVLDVGCGSGVLLHSLYNLGFSELVGIDPHVVEEVDKPGPVILKKVIHDLPDTKQFNVITFKHSFEHIPYQLETLKCLSNLLVQNGCCLISMPIKSEYIWDKYGIYWVQIDAPRHFFIHTVTSFEILVRNAGLKIRRVVFDSNELQFWGSEQYKRDIPLEDKISYVKDPANSVFTPDQISSFRKMAKRLNKRKSGDQATFYLERVS